MDRARAAALARINGLGARIGDRSRQKAVLLLAAILAVESADLGVMGALAPQLESSLHIGNTKLGLLVTISALVGAVGTIPAGALVDRMDRTRLLTIGVAVWGAAEVLSSLASGYTMLLVFRMALGVVTAIAGPAVASLTGDLFPAEDRSRMYGFILTGDFIGAGAGVMIAGLVSGWFGWRAAFAVMVLPSAALAWGIHRWMAEPERGQQTCLETRTGEIHDAVLDEVRDAGVEASPDIVVRHPGEMNLTQAVRWVLKVRSNLTIISASALGYFFLAGVETFALLYIRGQYHLSQSAATMLILVIGVGAVAGAVGGGRLADGLIKRGRVDGRLLVGAAGFFLGAALFVPAVATTSLFIAVPLYVLAGAAVAAPNPAMDAARLDVVPAVLWGRAEGVRSLFRAVLQAFAPLLFGVVSAQFGARSPGFGGVAKNAPVSPAQTHGLEYTLLIMLLTMVAGGVCLLVGRRWYPTDVASAGESDERAEAEGSIDARRATA